MDIIIGSVDSTRELNIEDAAGGEEVKAVTSQKLVAGRDATELSGGADQEYLISANKVAYVRAGNGVDRKVGFFA